MLTAIILGAAVGLFIAYIYQWKRKYSKMPPGPKPLPVLGNFQEIKDSTMLYDLTRLGSQHDGIFTVHLLMEPVLILDQFHTIRDLLLSPAYADIFSGRVNSYISKYLLPDDLFFQTASDTQQYLRKLTFRGIKRYGTALKNVEHLAQAEIQEMINRCRERNEVSFDPWNDLNQYVSNVILVMLCGRRFQLGHKTLENCQKISDAYVVLLHHKNQFLIDNVPFSTTLIPQLRHACQSLKDGCHYFTETFDKISQESKDTTPNCLYTLLLQEHEEGLISTENIKGVMVDSVLAGVITTKPTMYNALAAMVNFPEVQKKIQEEIQRVVGKDRLPGFEDRNEMPYSKAVELEIHRFYTPVGTPGPRNTTQDCSYKGYSIPKGTRFYRHNILEEHVVPLIRQHRPRFVFHDGIAGTHEYCYRLPPTSVLTHSVAVLASIGLVTVTFPSFGMSYTNYIITVIYNVWRVHHDESFWENPFTFDPTRFLDDNGELLPSEDEKRQRLLTFGVGKRSCIGEKLARVRIFLGLTSILQNFDLVRDPSEPFPSSDPSTYEPKFISQPPPYKLQFKPRH